MPEFRCEHVWRRRIGGTYADLQNTKGAAFFDVLIWNIIGFAGSDDFSVVVSEILFEFSGQHKSPKKRSTNMRSPSFPNAIAASAGSIIVVKWLGSKGSQICCVGLAT